MGLRTRRSTTTMVVAVVGSFLFLGFSVLLIGSSTTSRATANARSLHWVNATTGSISAVRASLSQAVLFSLGEAEGFADAGASQRAFEEAATSLGRAEAWVDEMGPAGIESDVLEDELRDFLQSGRVVLATLDAGDAGAADVLFGEQVERAWASLEIDLVQRQQKLAEAIGDAEGFSGFVSALSKVALMVLVPVGAMLVYRWQARREQRETRVKLEAELAAEQDLGRMKSQFIAGVSHELRTPLTSVVGFSHLLMEGGFDAQMARELVFGISGEAEELSRMVEDLLVASRPEEAELPVHLQDCDVAAEVEAVVAPQRRLGRTVHVRLEPGGVRSDAARLRQILRNLISNAHKHGGPTVWVAGAPRGTEYLLVVADDGEGVGPEASRRLFKPFAHAGEVAVVSGSVGLGLSVARQLARHLDGDLTYERAEGWTQFILRLPLAPSPVEAVAPDAAHQQLASSRKG